MFLTLLALPLAAPDPAPIDALDRPLNAYVGKYEYPASGTITIRATGSSLRWSYHRFAAALDPVGVGGVRRLDTFRLREPVLDDLLLTFHLAGDGGVESLEMLGGFQTTFRRVAD